jgi:hypothetical protein
MRLHRFEGADNKTAGTMARRPPDNNLPRVAYRVRAGGTAGLICPILTFSLSATVAGSGRTGGKAGVANPMRTLRLSAAATGAGWTAGKAGVANPMRTVPLSLIAGLAIFTVLISFTVLSNI